MNPRVTIYYPLQSKPLVKGALRQKSLDLTQSTESVFTRPVVATIGNFDGVHLGHQDLLNQVVERAFQHDCDAVVVSFSPHPAHILKDKSLPLLSTSLGKLKHFQRLKIDAACVFTFDQTFSDLSPEGFVEGHLLPLFHLHTLVVGYDFSFGKARTGQIALLKTLAAKHEFKVVEVPALQKTSQIVSSSRIRHLLQQADFLQAEALLGYPWGVWAQVEHGRGEGAQLGFPTLNLQLDSQLPLQTGVYACWVQWEQQWYAAVSNYGIRPTMDQKKELTLECHLFDFSSMIYGQYVQVVPIQKVRDEQAFSSVEALKVQIAKDCEHAKAILKQAIIPATPTAALPIQSTTVQ